MTPPKVVPEPPPPPPPVDKPGTTPNRFPTTDKSAGHTHCPHPGTTREPVPESSGSRFPHRRWEPENQTTHGTPNHADIRTAWVWPWWP